MSGLSPKISLILPVYNVEKYLRRCLDSIITQTMSADDIEVILVDDGAKDSSGKICDEYALKYQNIQTIHQQNAGVAAARNKGLENAKGEYVAFIDPDDYIEKDYCLASYEEAKRTNADIVLFDSYRVTQVDSLKNKTSEEKKLQQHGQKNFTTTDIKDIALMQCKILYPYMASQLCSHKNVPLAAPWDKIYRREFLFDCSLKFPSELRVLDDMSFNFITFGAAKNISYISVPLYDYCIWETSITNSYKSDRPLQDMKVFSFIKEHILKKESVDNLPPEHIAALWQAYYARIIKSFAICCRLYFFNKSNPKNNKERLEEVKKYMSQEPYNSAFDQVKTVTLEWKLRIVRVSGKLKSPLLLMFLSKLQNG